MKRIKITAICMSLLATLSMVGCVCTPGYYPGIPQFGYGFNYSHGSMFFDDSCGPCGPQMSCGVEMSCDTVALGSAPCFPQRGTIVDCRTSLSNIGNGVLLVGRGVLDITAAPFVIVGNLLSSGCRYEVLVHCPDVHCVDSFCQTVDPCCSVVSASGCDTCDNGFIHNGRMPGIQYDNTQSRATISSPPVLRRGSTVIQASHREPSTSSGGVRFVQPR